MRGNGGAVEALVSTMIGREIENHRAVLEHRVAISLPL
jgi:hypothetical protein